MKNPFTCAPCRLHMTFALLLAYAAWCAWHFDPHTAYLAWAAEPWSLWLFVETCALIGMGLALVGGELRGANRSVFGWLIAYVTLGSLALNRYMVARLHPHPIDAHEGDDTVFGADSMRILGALTALGMIGFGGWTILRGSPSALWTWAGRDGLTAFGFADVAFNRWWLRRLVLDDAARRSVDGRKYAWATLLLGAIGLGWWLATRPKVACTHCTSGLPWEDAEFLEWQRSELERMMREAPPTPSSTPTAPAGSV